MCRQYYAHTVEGKPPSEWQKLEDHLRRTAENAREFASQFGAGDWAYLVGLWHDLGKYSNEFQHYLGSVSSADPHIADSAPGTDHSTAGAQHVRETIPSLGAFLAYVLAGHHAGLADGRDSSTSNLEDRLKKTIPPWRPNASSELVAIPDGVTNILPSHLIQGPGAPFSLAFWLRMIFSCLVDADFLDTERVMNQKQAQCRPSWPKKILDEMEAALERRYREFLPPARQIDRQREAIHAACVAAAEKKPGVFTLTVPTGGGKTLSSLAFALRHARRHHLQRVVYVIPFTSIIEQNAAKFREVFVDLAKEIGHDPVLEHHCNFDPDDSEKGSTASRLATQNWDSPLVVTTSVQFFESLFSNRTSHCRKLHNIARSVVILDEAQNLPVEYLKPCLLALHELSAHYGATIVLCTATQPAITKRKEFPIGLDIAQDHEIIRDPTALYREPAFQRVEIAREKVIPDEQLAERIGAQSQVLCIVNTRRHARTLFETLGTDNPAHFHLSASMCPLHRSATLEAIRERLDAHRACRVISTQIIEGGQRAGDLEDRRDRADFPGDH